MEISYKLEETGIILPVESSEKPLRVFGLLEIEDDYSRKKFQGLFTAMLNDSYIKYQRMQGQVLPVQDARKQQILNLARLLLGDDFSYEELC